MSMSEDEIVVSLISSILMNRVLVLNSATSDKVARLITEKSRCSLSNPQS